MSNYLAEPDAGRRIMRRCDELAANSAPGSGVTRLYLSREHKAAIDLVSGWMREAGMEVHVDAAANIVGCYHAAAGAGPYLILGSHIDSVIEAGKYDGPLGVVCAIDRVAVLNGNGRRLPFGIEVLAFGDEEGTRFRTTLVGSSAVSGSFEPKVLDAPDANGTSLAEAMRAFGLDPALIPSAAHDRNNALAYIEVHIEQGPVLEQEDLPIGIVTAISGQTRQLVTLRSQPNHAGTVPMRWRHDPFLAGAEIALAAERLAAALSDAVATVGQVDVRPGAMNVIPGQVTLSLDMRARSDGVRHDLVSQINTEARHIAAARGVEIEIKPLLDMVATPCAPWLVDQIEAAVVASGARPLRLPSGAGHDGMAMIGLTDIGMIFVRCKAGISHSPLESVEPGDVAIAAQALLRFIEAFGPRG
jgi:allantoate deiminase